ncbi:MAG: tetratricopeptide repeat protein [Acidobacteria bacterium]|nr:tetratricopeptide repeat protein [Acidobacteriota bacterium]
MKVVWIRWVVLALVLPTQAGATDFNFRQRAGWNQLDPEVLALLEKRLTAAELRKFVQMSESQDLVRKSYLALAGPKAPRQPQRAPFVLGSMAVLFTDIGNRFGEQNDPRNAGAYAAMALKLNPNHVPALFTLIQIYLQTGNCQAAKSLIQMGRETLSRLKSIPEAKRPDSGGTAAKVYEGMEKQLDLFDKSC